MGQQLSLWGSVTRRRPISSCLRTITHLRLWTPARTIAMNPGANDALSFLAWPEKKFGVSLWCWVLGGVVIGQLGDMDHTGLSTLGSSNLLLDKERLCSRGCILYVLLDELVNALFTVCGRLAEPVNSTL